MPDHSPPLIDTFKRWLFEYQGVEPEAHRLNLKRVRALAPLMAVVNAVHFSVFLYQLLTASYAGLVFSWKLGLVLAHLGMGLTMLFCGYSAHRLLQLAPSDRGRWLPALLRVAGMLFVIVIVTLDQWVTPNITPFLLGCLVISMVILMRPVQALWFYLAAYAVFFYALGLTQSQAELLLSNRLNGLAVTMIGWGLSVMLCRNFTVIALQKKKLEEIHDTLQTQHQELQRLTRLDGLTGLFNRNTVLELAQQELTRAQRYGTPTSVLMLDIDHFKQVNDHWGHPVGDAVLRHVAALLGHSVRGSDVVARMGGEEFMLLLPQTAEAMARQLAEKIRLRIAATPTPLDGQSILVTVSVGVASTSAADNRDFDHLYLEADKALYQAKQGGRNRVA